MRRQDKKAAAMPAQEKPSFGSVVEELEARVLFSGGAEALFATNQQDDSNSILLDNSTPSAIACANDSKIKESCAVEQSLELVFIDSATPDYQDLLRDLQKQRPGRDFEVFILDSDSNGIEQISSKLQQYNDVDAIHLVSHGSDGEISLGNTLLDNENLPSYQSAISAWQQYLSADADLLIYGCDVAETTDGEQLLQQLARLTGADITASNDATGHSALGGDWDLEYRHGSIETEVAFSAEAQKNYAAILPNSTPVNNGPFDSWNKSVLSTPEDNAAADVISADIDGDGDIDIAAVSRTDDSVVWFENNGSGGFTAHILSTTEDSANSIRIADIDGDGDMDFATAAQLSNTVAWWRNDGSQNFTRITINTNVDYATWVELADIDGDGDMDVLAAEAGPSGNLLWFENDGSENFTEHTVGSSFSTQSTHNLEGIRVTDLDGDGDKDLLATFPYDNDVVWFENNGSQSFTKRTVDSNALDVRDVEAADMDGDGDLDLVAAIKDTHEVVWYENNGSQSFTKHVITNSFTGAHTISLSDVNGDGRIDIVSSASDANEIRLFTNNGGGSFTSNVVASGFNYAEGITTGDFDGDGDLDIAGAAASGDEFAWFENTMQIVKAGESLTFSAANGNLISVSDSDIGSRSLSLQLVATNGTLTLSGTNGLSFSVGDGTEDSMITVSGSLADINAALDGMTFNAPDNTIGGATVAITSTDPGSPSDPKSDTDGFNISIVAGNTVTVTTGSDISDGDTSSIAALLSNKGADGQISLREAILATNNTANGTGPDKINFAIPNGDASYQSSTFSWQINLSTALPTISDALVIDGLTQGSGTDMRITINGASAGAGVDGLTINASASTIRGLNIQGFSGAGILVSSGSNHVIERNFIGTDITGTSAVANATGIILQGTTSNVTIGSDSAGMGNLISGNTGDGIYLFNASSNSIKANLIGIDLFGNTDLGNGGYGIQLRDSSSNIIGTTTSLRNTISGNDSGGLAITHASHSNIVRGNYIGTNYAGTAAIGNTNDGIVIADGADNNVIGGDRTASQGNVLSGNSNDGIEIEDTGTSGNQLYGNYIGVDASGNFALGNARHGVVLFDGAANTIIGGTGTGQGNVISSNSIDGIVIDGWNDNTTAGNRIIGNFIGTNAAATADLGNGDDGIHIFGQANNNQVGGLNSNEGNIITNNSGEGIQVHNEFADNNAFLGNAIYGNTQMGINLGTDAVTANDLNDADTGPNDEQNFAIIDSVQTSGGNTIINGSLTSTPNSNYIIEFFHAPASDAHTSGAGGARTSLGTISVTTNGSGYIWFSRSVTALPDGNIVTTIVTEDLGGGSYGSSSEFSANVAASSNTAPVLTDGANGGVAYSEDSWGNIFGSATVSDSDSADFDTGVLTAAFTAGNEASDQIILAPIGGVSLSGSDVLVSGTVVGTFAGGTGGTDLTVTFNSNATLANVNSVYQSITLRTTSDNPTPGERTVSVTLTDGDGGTSNTATGRGTLNAVNDAPVLDNSGTMTFTTITENDTSNTGNTVAEIISSAGGDRITDVDSTTEGIAITEGSQTGGGNWQYSTDGGSTWTNFGSVSESNALLLRDSDRVRFLPDTISGETGSIHFKAWDQSSGTAGNKVDTTSGNAFSSAQELADITVTEINDSSVIGNLATQEIYLLNTAANLNGFTVSDLDDSNITVTLTLGDPAAGSLNTATAGSVTSSFNAGTGVWSASGDITDINTLLSGLVFTPSSGYTSDVVLNIATDDGDTTVNASKTIVFDAAATATNTNVTDVGNEDIALDLTDIVITEDNGTVIVGIALSDPTAGSLNTATSGGVTSSYNAGTGIWTASGAVTDVNALLAGLTFTPTSNYTGSVNLALTIGDGVNAALTDTKTITINPVNDAPVLDNSGTMTLSSITENDTGNNGNSVSEIIASAGGDRITDSDGPAEGIAITAATHTSASNGRWQFSDDGGSTWQDIATVSNSNALLLRDNDRVRFLPDGDNGDIGVLDFKAWDQSSGIAGTYTDTSSGTAFSTASEQAQINVTPVNDGPTATNMNSPETYLIDTPFTLIPITVADVDDPALTVRLTLSDPTAGSFSTGTVGSTTAIYDAGTGVWTASGPPADLNILLASIVFTPGSGYGADFDIATSVSDGSATITSNKSVTFNAAPVASNTGSNESTDEDIALDLTDIVISDDDAVVSVTLTLGDPAAGTLSTGSSGSTTATYNAGTGVWTASGPVAEINSLLAGVTFTPSADYNGSTTLSSSISDGVNAAVTDSKLITVNAVNDAPVLDSSGSMTLTSITEDDTNNNGNSVAEIISSAGGDRITDIDSVSEGIALTAHNNSSGHWEYSIDGGSSWTNIGTVSTTNALLLRDSDRLRFVPDGIDGLTATLTFHAWDQHSGSAGTHADISTSNSVSSNTEVASLLVSAVNDAPTVLGLNTAENYTEDQTHQLSALLIDDVDDSVVTVTLTLSNPAVGVLNTGSAGSATATFNLNSGVWQVSGNISDVNLLLADLQFTPNANVDENFVLSVLVSDGTDNISGNKAFTATPVNDAPSAANDDATLNEGGSVTLQLLSNDNDIDDGINSSSLEIVRGPTHGQLTLNADGSVTYTHDDSENFSDTFSYRVRDNAGQLSNTAEVQLTINPVNDNRPQTQDQEVSMMAGDDLDSEYSLLSSASDSDNDSLQIILIDGPDHGTLELRADGTFTYTPDNNYNGVDRFTYVISDGDHVSELATVAIRVQAPIETNDTNKPQKPKDNSPDDLVDNKSGEEESVSAPESAINQLFDTKRPDNNEEDVLEGLRFLKNNPEITPLPGLDLWSAETNDDRRLRSEINLGQLNNDIELDQLQSLFADSDFLNELNDRRLEEEQEQLQEEYLSQAVAASGLSVSAGIVSWILRGGSLAAGMLSTLPGWRGIDPLPVLSRREKAANDELDDNAREAEELFEKKNRRKRDKLKS
jgi:hypothetical protein